MPATEPIHPQGPPGRKFFPYALLQKPGELSHSVLRSYAPKGFFNSGYHYMVIRSDGGRGYIAEPAKFVSDMIAAGFADVLDVYRKA